MKRRIVKETALYGVSMPNEYTRPRERFVVEYQNGLGKWETELIPLADFFKEKIPAIFGTEKEALDYVNDVYGKIGREIIWESN